MSLVITIAASVFVFGLIIFVHELGHYLAAVHSGVRVIEFAIGMGPAIVKWNRHDVKYSLRLFPIGGFCSMDEDSDEAGPLN